MEPITATMVATLIFSKAAEEGGKKLGEAVSNKVSQLLNTICEKFKAEGVEGKLTRVQEEPSDKNRSRFEQELANQMEDDNEFANTLKALVEELRSDEQIKQIFFKNVRVKQDAEVGNIEQTATPGAAISQEAIMDVEVGGNLKIGNVKQKS